MEGNSSLDLTHLTEEEQSAILQVLQRDLDLQLVDEGRVRSEEPGADGDGPPASALTVGRLVHRGVQQAAPGRVGQRPGPRLHPPPQDEEQSVWGSAD